MTLDNATQLIGILLMVVCILLLVSLIRMSLAIFKYLRLKEEKLFKEIEHEKLEKENKSKIVEYSNLLLELIRNILGQIAVLKFRTFQDTHDMTKVNKSHFEALAKDIAEAATRSLNEDNISFEGIFFTKEFYEDYIIQTSIILVKEMLDKVIEDV